MNVHIQKFSPSRFTWERFESSVGTALDALERCEQLRGDLTAGELADGIGFRAVDDRGRVLKYSTRAVAPY